MRRHRWAGQPLEGRGVVVVGATSGVGRATAEEFAAHGCRIMLAARDTGQLDVVAADCRRRGAAWVGWCPTDISSSESVDALAAAAVRDLGHVDVWVNLAATLVAGDVTDCPPEDLRRIVDVNVTG
nr:SDR family NAD(P)-dependent oxidoreductase [Acidimicrobiia bacterium]